MRSSLVCLCVIALGLGACGDDSSAGSAGSGGSGGGSGSAGAAGNAGSGGAGGSSGAGGTNGVGDAGSQTDASTAADSGSDSGPALSRCRAPTPATNAGNTCPAGAPVALKATKIAGEYNFPVLVTHAPGDPDERLFVVERFGAIQIVKNGTKLDNPFIELSVYATESNEQGLLGLAFDPNYEVTGRFWVNYIKSTGIGQHQSVIESYTAKASNPDEADTSTKKPLITLEDPESNHNGGMLAFGPDGCLFIAAGDGGGGDDLHSNHGSDGNGQSLETGLGKMLRIDVENPDDAAPGNLTGAGIPWIWDYGLRNPWRFSFNRKTGDMYIGDVGQGQWEEIDVEPSGHGQNNYGWRFTEGKHCRGDAENAATPTTCAGHDYADFVAPVHDYFHTNNDNCVIGGYVYRGKNIPSLDGYYLFADHNSNHVWAFVWDGTKACSAPIDLSLQLTVTGKITSFGEDSDGEIYITTHEGDGSPQQSSVFRIDPN